MLEPHPEAQIEAERQPLLAPDDSNPKDGANQVTPPEKILLRVFAASLSFLVMGIHTAAVGVLIPSMEPYWAITDSQVSLLFVTPLSGYLLASASNSSIHAAFGRRGIAIIGSVCQLLVTIVVALPPSYPIFLLAFAAAGFGIGLIDAGWCAWAGGLRNANTVSGLLHGAYSAGATMGPYLAATLIEGLEWPWWGFYWVMVCLQDDVDRGMLLMTANRLSLRSLRPWCCHGHSGTTLARNIAPRRLKPTIMITSPLAPSLRRSASTATASSGSARST